MWLIGSALFALYVRNWGSYGETYGALGGVVVLLMWFYLSGYIITLGAEINAELERQTKEDTTVGTPKRMGARRVFCRYGGPDVRRAEALVSGRSRPHALFQPRSHRAKISLRNVDEAPQVIVARGELKGLSAFGWETGLLVACRKSIFAETERQCCKQ